MRRRLDLAASLITRPPLIFLDEPTTGLDPRTRGQMWDTIRELVAQGCTVLLTTQYLDEADQLADRIAVIDRGRKVAQGTPDQLKSQVGSSTLQLRLLDPAQTSQAVDVVRRVVGDEPVLTPEAGGINVPLADANRAADVLIGLREQELLITAATVQKPTLDEVFMALTGHAAEDRATTTRRSPSDDPPVHHRRPDRHRGHRAGRPRPAGPPVGRRHRQPDADHGLARDRRRCSRNSEQFFDVTIQPLLFTAMFAGIFGGAISGDVQSYLPLIIPGLIAQTVLTACMATGVQIREDMDKGVFDRFKSLPIARIAPLAGPMLADMLRYFIASVLTFATGIAMGYRPGGGVFGVAGAIVLAVFAGWSLAWIFAWFGTVGRSAQGVQGISLMMMFPLTFLSNAFVPIETMPGWLEAFAKVNPVSTVITAVRDLANDGDSHREGRPGRCSGCAVVVAIFAPLAVRSYGRKM